MHSVVIDLGRGTSAASIHLSPFSALLFFTKLYVKNNLFCECLSVPFCFFQFFEHISAFFAAIVLQSQHYHGRKFIFSSFHSLVFILIFLSFFFSLLLYCQGDLKAEDKTRHQDNWVKAVVGMVNKVWKGVFCWRVFEHDRRSELMGLDQPGRMPWLIILGKVWQQWCVSCDWVTCVWHRQPAGHPPVNAYHHLLMFSLSLSIFTLFLFTLLLQQVAKKVKGKIGQLEAVKLNLED